MLPSCDFESRVTARDIRMVEHDLPRHCLTADRQAVIERQAIGRDASCGALALSSLIASKHWEAPPRSQRNALRDWDTTIAAAANRPAEFS